MTSILLEEEESNVTRLKQKSQTHTSRMSKLVSDESRSFLNFSRENLSISNSDLEQGFNRSRQRVLLRYCSRQTLLSCAALLLALSCTALELWKLRCVLANSRSIEMIKKDVETLKHRFLEKDLLDELKAFEEQLYGEGTSDEEDPSANGISSDYDSSYDDSSVSSGDYPSVTYSNSGSSSSLSTSSPLTIKSTHLNPTTPCTSKDLEDVLAVLRRAEAERGRDFEHRVAKEREQLLQKHRAGNDDDGDRSKRQIKKSKDVGYFYTRLKRTTRHRKNGDN